MVFRLSTSIIGRDIIRKDAWDKVTGRAKYNSDVSYPVLLHGVVCALKADNLSGWLLAGYAIFRSAAWRWKRY